MCITANLARRRRLRVNRYRPRFASGRPDVRFSNRPFGVKHFQTIHRYSVDVARGLVLLFGIGTKGPSIMGFEDEVEQPMPRPYRQSMPRPYRQSDGGSKRTCELTSSIVPRGTSSTARWSSSVLLSDLILPGFHAAAAACSRVQRNSVPSTQMRCMITANRRAKATIAFFGSGPF